MEFYISPVQLPSNIEVATKQNEFRGVTFDHVDVVCFCLLSYGNGAVGIGAGEISIRLILQWRQSCVL